MFAIYFKNALPGFLRIRYWLSTPGESLTEPGMLLNGSNFVLQTKCQIKGKIKIELQIRLKKIRLTHKTDFLRALSLPEILLDIIL